MSKITDLLKEVGKDVLNEDSLKQIETVFTEAVDKKSEDRANIATEAALAKQDDEHSAKLEQLLESIDKDHTKKLNKVVEAVDADRTRKLKNVVRRFQTALNNGDCRKFLIDLSIQKIFELPIVLYPFWIFEIKLRSIRVRKDSVIKNPIYKKIFQACKIICYKLS